MKLVLLALLVLAALLSNVSESRIVSKCELKDKLAEAINKTRGPEEVTEEILAAIICEVSRRSNLDTSVVKIEGIRHPLTTAQPTSNAASGSRWKQSAPSRGRHHSEKKEKEMEKHDKHMTNEDSSESFETTEPVSSNSTAATGSSRNKREAHDRRRYHSEKIGGKTSLMRGMEHNRKDMSNEHSSEGLGPTEAVSSNSTSSNSTAATGSSRRKREAHDRRRYHSEKRGEKGKDKSHKRGKEHGSEDMSNEDSAESFGTTEAVSSNSTSSNSTAATGSSRRKKEAHDRRRYHSEKRGGKGKDKSHKRGKEHDSEDMSNEDSSESFGTTEAVSSNPTSSNSTAATGSSRRKREAHDRRRYHSEKRGGKGKDKSHKRRMEHDSEDMSNEDSAESFGTTKAVSSNSTVTSGNSRKKRGFLSRQHLSGETLNEIENRFDEEEMAEDDEYMSKEDSFEEDRFLGRRDPYKITLWSLGSYGIFQLRDSHFCDSGYRWSRNLCQKSCTDFTDDDITDDIDCFLKEFFDGYLLRTRSLQCDREAETFLQDCS